MKKTVSKILIAINILLFIIITFFLLYLNFIPIKYIIIILCSVLLYLILYLLIIFSKKKLLVFKFLFGLLSIICSILCIVIICFIYDTYRFAKNNLDTKYNTYDYYIIANDFNDNIIKNIDYIGDKEDISYIEDNYKYNIKYINDSTISEKINEIRNGSNNFLLVSSGIYDAFCQYGDEDDNPNILQSIKVIKKIEFQKKDNNKINTKVGKSFWIYIEGIDTRTNNLPFSSLNDANILLYVNPTSKKVVMINIPRDYYMSLGKSNVYDKLNHIGAIGGMPLVKSSIENLLDIDIGYYIRLNFNSVSGLVDSIGGIEINNDQNFTIKSSKDSNCIFYEGINYVDGNCALAFSREKKAYGINGEIHRGANQEQIIFQIVKKLVSTNTGITNYSKVLKSLNNTIETNFSINNITSLIKKEINDIKRKDIVSLLNKDYREVIDWDIVIYNVEGNYIDKFIYMFDNRLMSVIKDEKIIEIVRSIKTNFE